MTVARPRAATIQALALLLLAPTSAHAASQQAFDREAAAIRATLMAAPQSGLSAARRAEPLARQLASERERGIALATVERLEGEAYARMDAFDRAAPLVAHALALVRRLAPGSKLEGDIRLSSGSVHAGQIELAAALGDYQQAHRIFQALGDTRDQAVTLLSIGTLYGDANDQVSALKYLDQAIQIDGNDPKLMLSIYHNRAATLQELGRYQEAEQGYRKALVLAERLNSQLLQARILGNIARVQLKIGNVAGAEGSVNRALAIAAQGEAATWRPQLVAVAAQAAFQRHDLPRAAALIAERFRGVDLTTTSIAAREAHQTAYDTYRALGDAPRAIVHLAALKRLDDQATRLATSANSALAAAQFDFKNQELRLAVLKADEADRNAQYERQRAHTERLIFLGVAVATAIIIALLAVWLATMRRSRNRVKAAADDLAITNAALGKALAAKTEFLATTSHEIRTPLNGILGMTQVMLADPRLPIETRDRIGVVHGAGVTMRALVDDILDVAKMETGNLTVERAPFDLAATLADAAKLWAEQARDKGIGFALDLGDCPGWIEGDAARVRQIAFNLLSNALKFTAAGQVSLRVRRDADRYRILVEDSGIGIAADKLDEIFESFKQADAGTTRQFGGTGLGLAICRNLTRAMAGTVEVASVPGRGSTFTVTLPLVEVRGIGGEAAAPEDEGGVVIVDANPITRAMLKTLIAGRQAAVAAVASLDEAIAIVGDAALVLIDQSAIAGGEALAPLAAATRGSIAVLWRGEAPEAVARSARVIAKPVGGPALLALLFDAQPEQSLDSSLVQQAA